MAAAKVFTCEANIAAGKSTLLSMLEELKLDKEHVVIYEQVSDWVSLIDPETRKSIFDLFYEDKKRYAYVFQTYVLMSRASHLKETLEKHKGKIIICERSIFTDYEIFAKSLHDSRDIGEMEFEVYKRWHSLVQDMFKQQITGQIYLRTSPQTCIERVAKRNRQSEDLIDIKYLEQLHRKHEEWMMGNDNEADVLPTLVVDGNQDLVSVKENRDRVLHSVATFINNLV